MKSKKAFATPTAVPQLSRLAHVQGRRVCAPNYDFNWQLYYELETPRPIPAGSKVTVVTLFGNSAKNRYNPATEPAAGALAVFLPADYLS